MKTTVEYFNVSIDELLNTNENCTTVEELKILNLGSVYFCNDIEEYKMESEDIILWYNEIKNMKLVLELETINGRIAMIFDYFSFE
jgi:hypothetical protein